MERDDIRMALDAYHRELAKLTASTAGGSPSQFPPPMFHPGGPLLNGLGGAQDLSMPKRLSPLDIKKEKDLDEKVNSGNIHFFVDFAC